jgi:hypothetical protein
MKPGTVNPHFRQAVIAELASKSGDKFGRTALMKCLYIMQTVRGVDLGYRFKIYTYGPYDSQVLDDLKSAEALSAVKAEPIQWEGGSGYILRAGESINEISRQAGDKLRDISEDIDWVASEFGGLSAKDLELIGTIIFLDRDLHKASSVLGKADIVGRVKEIKPHYSEQKIASMLQRLCEKNILLTSFCGSSPPAA